MKRTTSIIALTALTLVLSGTAVTAQLPDPGMKIDASNTALLVTDPQNDFLSPDGVTWGVVGQSVTENRTVENLECSSAPRRSRTFRCSSLRTTTTRTITAGGSRAPWRR